MKASRKHMKSNQQELSNKRATAGRRGGLAVVAKYGVEHMKKIGAEGARVFHARYRLTPVGTSQFAIIHRETNEVKAFLNGLPF